MDAQEVLSRYNPYIVNPLGIAANAGFTAVIPEVNMDSETCAKLLFCDGKPILYYNASHDETRQRFAIAHAMGHYFLGHLHNENHILMDTAVNFSKSVSDPREQQANSFAAELLVPMDILSAEISNNKRVDGYELAVKFGVSTTVLDMRVQEWQKVRSRAIHKMF